MHLTVIDVSFGEQYTVVTVHDRLKANSRNWDYARPNLERKFFGFQKIRDFYMFHFRKIQIILNPWFTPSDSQQSFLLQLHSVRHGETDSRRYE